MSLTTPPAVPSPFSRTASFPSSPGFRSRLPIPCKSPPSIRDTTPSVPSAPALGSSSSARLDERRAARDARPRPWSDRPTWAPAKPRCVRPSPAQLATLCPRRLFDRQQARQRRDRPWAVSASPCRQSQSSTSPSAATSSAAAAIAPSGLRGILKSRCSVPRAAKKKVVWSADSTVVEVSRWIKESEEYDDDNEVYEAMCF
ncbi:hypothetical protein PISL3812_01933 [Talaromyces islandicus]|uniref:Uncharacterized protein n=1 Tax=Talaromyces islandicus TaxID=28573 RepID=A0A0U1LP49_TALIS|nr:hypothetical protein PISL3812_01933 [Talaromyces islandicus]